MVVPPFCRPKRTVQYYYTSPRQSLSRAQKCGVFKQKAPTSSQVVRFVPKRDLFATIWLGNLVEARSRGLLLSFLRWTPPFLTSRGKGCPVGAHPAQQPTGLKGASIL